jgi:hypothetical protein
MVVVPSIQSSGQYPPLPPPSPYSYYGCFNFIFDTSGTIYYYQKFYDKDTSYESVIDFDSDAPIFINLSPDKIIKIPESALKAFFESNVLSADPAYKSIRIVGLTDTIRSPSVNYLMAQVSDTTKHIYHIVRLATLEERTVLDFMKKNKFYDADKVIWDSTQIWIDHPLKR